MLTFRALDPATLRKLITRINGMFWKRRRLSAQVMAERYI
jgi:hypothetical protein